MIESIKNKIWEIVQDKEISLVMIFNKKGEILWNKGRQVIGNNVFKGSGFSKTYTQEILRNERFLTAENSFVQINKNLPKSTEHLNIKSLLIIPIEKKHFLYIDSGSRKSFSENEIIRLKTLGEILSEEIVRVENKLSDIGELIGCSEKMLAIQEQMIKYAIVEETILITGESGVGKTHIAELIHNHSGRKGKFITVHTPSLSKNLFESELFGHKKGAFTDAFENKKGLVDEADQGTLFFDEISEVPISFQAKLLRFIDTKKYSIVGDTNEKSANTRIIAATNRNLNEMIKKNHFREDLFFRLQVLEIEIPPLRKRKEDIRLLASNFKNHLQNKTTGEGFFEALQNHDWPGNIRELINVLLKAGLDCQSPINGAEISRIITKSKLRKHTKEESHNNDHIENIIDRIKSGENFFEVAVKPFQDHNLTRDDIKKIIDDFKTGTRGKYINMIDQLNIPQKDYKKFLNFLHWNHLK